MRDRAAVLARSGTFFDSHDLSAMLAAHVMDMSAENSDLNPFELWDENELATRLGVPVTTVKSWRSRGGGPDWVRLGGKKARYRPQAVLEWLQRREQNVPTGEAS